MASSSDLSEKLDTILAKLTQLEQGQASLRQNDALLGTTVEAINGRVNALAGVKLASDGTAHDASMPSPKLPPRGHHQRESIASMDETTTEANGNADSVAPPAARRPSATTSKIILTSYPGQAGVDPLPMEWGAKDPRKRGPVVVSRNPSTIRRRNAVGAHGGSYSIYYALAVAAKQIDTDHKPDFTNTEPAVTLGPFPAWHDPKKIVAMDPLGHLAPWMFKDYIKDDNVEIRPTIAITKVCSMQ